MITVVGAALWIALKGIIFQLAASVGAKWALERAFFLAGEMIVKSTKTEQDDAWLADAKARYFNYKKEEVSETEEAPTDK